MSIDSALCASLAQATTNYNTYVPQAVQVALGPLLDPPPGSRATAVLSLEIIHADGLCQSPLADACVHVVSHDHDVRFVAPDPDRADNYVSYWHRESEPTGQQSGWATLAAGQQSLTHEVTLLGQTLPREIAKAPESGAGGGYLHHDPNRPTDGWTVRVGVWHNGGRQGLGGLTFDVVVSARPYWSSATSLQVITLL